MAADAPAHVTGSSKEESTYDEIYADAGAFFSMWHPPEAHQIKAGVVFEGFEACLGEVEAITPAGLEWVPGDRQGRYECIKSSHTGGDMLAEYMHQEQEICRYARIHAANARVL
jgi:hypothetical protein